MNNSQLIYNAICDKYAPAQRHEIVSRYYPAAEIEALAAKTHADPDENGNAPDPVELAEALLCVDLFHTFDRWKRDNLSVKRGEKAAITCKLWKLSTPKKNVAPDADELTKAAADQDNGNYYLANAYLFGRWQVEKRTTPAAGRFKSADEIRAYNKMLADQRRAAKVSAAVKTAAEAIAQDVTTETRKAAQQAAEPVKQEQRKPSTKKNQRASWTPGTVQIIMHNNPNSVLELNLQQFFPAPLPKLRQVMKLVCADSANSERITAAIVATLKQAANEYGPRQELARKNLVFLGEVKQDESPVKISSKPEFFEALDNNGKQRRTFDGYRATYNGFTFFITKARYANGKPSKGWNIFEARSGMGYAWCISKAKAAETIVKKFNPETLKNIDFDHLEALKKAAPLAPTITI